MPRTLALLALLLAPALAASQEDVVHYVRYEVDDRISYGILQDETIRELDGPPFHEPRATGRTHVLSSVRLIAPVRPSKVLAVGFNYRSHLGGDPPPEKPEFFAKLPSAVIGTGDPIVIPPDSEDLHYEGELVVVMGQRARDVPEDEAMDYVFGVTAGNDVSEREWQSSDLQWLRAKASDTFAPLGPTLARGLDYGSLLLETRVNGELRQSESSADLLFGIPALVSYISHYVTLLPGDVIYTGTPGTTRALSPGDTVEVRLEGVGTLRNPVVRASSRR